MHFLFMQIYAELYGRSLSGEERGRNCLHTGLAGSVVKGGRCPARSERRRRGGSGAAQELQKLMVTAEKVGMAPEDAVKRPLDQPVLDCYLPDEPRLDFPPHGMGGKNGTSH